MKLFGREFTLSLREKFKGFVDVGPSSTTAKTTKFWPGYKSWQSRCTYYEKLYHNHPLAKSCINTIAGKLTADGIFLESANWKNTSTETDPHEKPAKDAKLECDELNRQIDLTTMIHATTIRMIKLGSCFWERTDDPEFNVRIAPAQEYIEPMETNDEGEVARWRQRIPGKQVVEWAEDEIIHFPWNVTSLSWPYGTSQFVGLDTEFEILETLEVSIKDFMEKTAFPKELYQIGDNNWQPSSTDTTNIRNTIKNWQPGKAFVTNAPIDYKAGGVGPKAIANLDDVLTFYKTQIIDGLQTAPVSFQYSSTYASSKEMAIQERANIISPLRRIQMHIIENEVYKPYLDTLGYSVKLVPTIKWEPADAHWAEKVAGYTQLVSSNILTWEVAAQELGYGDRLEEMKAQKLEKQKADMQLMQQKFAMQPKPFGQEQPQDKFEERMQRLDGLRKRAEEIVTDSQFQALKFELHQLAQSVSLSREQDTELRQKEKEILDFLTVKLGVQNG